MNWTWFHKLGSSKRFYKISDRWLSWFTVAAALLVVTGCVWGLALALPGCQQGNSFRIIYIHVPAAFLAQSCYVMLVVAGAVGLIWKMKVANVTVQYAAPIGTWMAFVALPTGAVWGKPTWGVWWVWDTRLTAVLILLFLCFGIIALDQAISDRDSATKACAVLAIVGVVSIPTIKYSVEWWNALHQPATFTITGKPAMPMEMWLPLLIMVLDFYCFFAAMPLMRMHLEVLKRKSRTAWVKVEVKTLMEKTQWTSDRSAASSLWAITAPASGWPTASVC